MIRLTGGNAGSDQPPASSADVCSRETIDLQQELVYDRLIPLFEAFADPDQTPGEGYGNFIANLGNVPFYAYEFGDREDTMVLFTCTNGYAYTTWVNNRGPYNERYSYVYDNTNGAPGLGTALQEVDATAAVTGLREASEFSRGEMDHWEYCTADASSCEEFCASFYPINDATVEGAWIDIETACARFGEDVGNDNNDDHDHGDHSDHDHKSLLPQEDQGPVFTPPSAIEAIIPVEEDRVYSPRRFTSNSVRRTLQD